MLKAPKRLHLILMVLQRYHIEVQFVKGKDNVVADTLFRAAISPMHKDHQERDSWKKEDVFEIQRERVINQTIEKIDIAKTGKIAAERLEEIREATETDNTMQSIIGYIIDGWPKRIADVSEACKICYKHKDELSTQNGRVFRNYRIVIPFKLRKVMIGIVHVAHSGIEATLNLARQTIFWPRMSSEITRRIQGCEICIQFRNSQQQRPMQSHEVPDYQFQYVSMDGFFSEYKGKKREF